MLAVIYTLMDLNNDYDIPNLEGQVGAPKRNWVNKNIQDMVFGILIP